VSTIDDVVAEPEPAPERRTRPLLWIAIGVLLGVAVGAALLSRDDRSPAERVAAAPDAVADAGSYAYEIEIAVDLGGSKRAFSFAGAADTEAGRSRATVALPPTGGPPLTLVGDGSDLYIQVPEAVRDRTGGKPWARVDLGALVPGAFGSTIDPRATFDNLREVGAEVEDSGRRRCGAPRPGTSAR
jgi:hypothetical protein